MVEQRSEPRVALDDLGSLAAPQVAARLDFLAPLDVPSTPVLKGVVMHRSPMTPRRNSSGWPWLGSWDR